MSTRLTQSRLRQIVKEELNRARMSLNEADDDYYGDEDPFGDDAALAAGQEYNPETASYEPPAPMRKIRPTLGTSLESGAKYKFSDMIAAASAITQAVVALQRKNKDRMNITFQINSNQIARKYGLKPDHIEALLSGASVYFSAYPIPESPGNWMINV